MTSRVIKNHVVYCDADQRKKMYKPTELDIYHEPNQDVLVFAPTPQSPLIVYEYVSAGRKRLTNMFSGLLTTHERISDAVTSTKQKIKGTYHRTLDDPMWLWRPGAILVAASAGALLAGKGRRPVKRTAFSLLFGTVAASACYPQRALDIATTGYYHTSSAISQMMSKPKRSEVITEKVLLKKDDEKKVDDLSEITLSDNIERKDEEISESVASEVQDVQQELKVESVRDITVSVKKDDVIENTVVSDSKDVTQEVDNQDQKNKDTHLEGDIGQSNPEDADMYTTRS